MSVSFEFFRVFFAIARYQNITRAAEDLCLSRPTVTQELQKLETQIGFPLFRRHSRGVTLTPEGKELFHRISPAIQTLLDTERELEASKNAEKMETVKICFTRPHTMHAFQEYLAHFQAEHPEIVIQSSIIPYALIADALHSGFTELALGARHDYKPYFPGNAELPGIQTASLGIFEDKFLVHEHLSRLAITPVRLSQLSDFSFIFYKDRDMQGMESYLSRLRQRETLRDCNLFLSELDAIFNLLRRSDSIAVVPAFQLHRAEHDFVYLNIDDPIIRTEYLMQFSSQKAPSPAAVKLIDFLRNTFSLPPQT